MADIEVVWDTVTKTTAMQHFQSVFVCVLCWRWGKSMAIAIKSIHDSHVRSVPTIFNKLPLCIFLCVCTHSTRKHTHLTTRIQRTHRDLMFSFQSHCHLLEINWNFAVNVMRYATGKMNKNIYAWVWTGDREGSRRRGKKGMEVMETAWHMHTPNKTEREKSRAKKGTLILISCRLNTRKLNQ